MPACSHPEKDSGWPRGPVQVSHSSGLPSCMTAAPPPGTPC